MDGLIEYSALRKTAQLRVVKLYYFSLNRTRCHDSLSLHMFATYKTHNVYMKAEMIHINSKFSTAHVP